MEYCLNGVRFGHPLGCNGVEYWGYKNKDYVVVFYLEKVLVALPDGKGGLVYQNHLQWHRNHLGVGKIVPK
jgi:hypothetical protein